MQILLKNSKGEKKMKEKKGSETERLEKRQIIEAIGAVAGILILFGGMGSKMGMINMLNTLMNTAYALLIDTVFFIMAVAVLAGALGSLFGEFGVVAVINRLISPLMKPIWGLPGAASLGVITTYLSDNPAILALAHDQKFRRYFKKYQLPALTNIGTAFGMGFIITAFMLGLSAGSGEGFGKAVLVGNLSAVIGSVVSTRIMLTRTKKIYGTEAVCEVDLSQVETKEDGPRKSVGMRILNSLMDGGKTGVDLGLAIIPGVLIICTLVMMLTNGPSAEGIYTGAAYEGIGLLPFLGDKVSFILKPLFGFSHSEAVAVPITALGSAGAAIGMVPELLKNGLVNAGDIAVFTAMCMCWSGYLSTHVSMMDSLKENHLTGAAIISHTIGGLVAGVAAHWLYVLIA